MATIVERAESLVRLISGGIDTSETKFEQGFLYAKLNEGRAFVLRQDYAKTKRWNPVAIQRYYPEYVKRYQVTGSCYIRFRIPSVINVEARKDGIIYIGSSTKSETFRRIKSRTELSDFNDHPVMSAQSGLYTAALVTNRDVEIYSKNIIKYPMVEAIFNEPHLLPDYNIEKDEYPIDDSLMAQIETYLLQQSFGLMASTPADTLSSGSDNAVLQPQGGRRR